MRAWFCRGAASLGVAALCGLALAAGCANILDIPGDPFVVLDGGAGGGGVGGGGGTGGTGTCTGAIKIRILADLTGATATVSVPYYQAQVDYFRELNEQGGIRGCPIEYDDKDYAYDIANAQAIYDEWKSREDWDEVAALFGWGSGDTLALAPQLSDDHKPMISASYIGALAAPQPVRTAVDVPELSSSFEELSFPTLMQSPGFPYNFFAGTDYSTGARIAMFHIKALGGKRVGFFHCSAEYCAGPIPAARSYAKELGLELGRDLVLELTEDQATYNAKVQQYFQEELAQANLNPGYQPVDWLWFGNTTKTAAYAAIAVDATLDSLPELAGVQIMMNNWGMDELLYGVCGAPCVGRVHGIMPFLAYGDAAHGSSEMPKVTALHDKWRQIDYDRAMENPGDAGAPVLKEHRNVRYVQGYVSAMLFRMAAERVIDQGLPIKGDNIRDALETFQLVDTGGLTDAITFSADDHRPQSTESIYLIDADGTLRNEPPDRTITLEQSWLGW